MSLFPTIVEVNFRKMLREICCTTWVCVTLCVVVHGLGSICSVCTYAVLHCCVVRVILLWILAQKLQYSSVVLVAVKNGGQSLYGQMVPTIIHDGKIRKVSASVLKGTTDIIILIPHFWDSAGMFSDIHKLNCIKLSISHRKLQFFISANSLL